MHLDTPPGSGVVFWLENIYFFILRCEEVLDLDSEATGRVLSWIKICLLPAYSWLVIGEMWVSSLEKISRLSL